MKNRSHHRRATPLPILGGDHPGFPCPLSPAELDAIGERHPFGFPFYSGRCWLCDRTLSHHDTCAGLPSPSHTFRFICYECLTGLNVHNGFWTDAQAARLSPIAGAYIDAPYIDKPPDRPS